MIDWDFWLGFVLGFLTGASVLCLGIIWAAKREGG